MKMKKIITIAMLAILGVTLFIACRKEKNTAGSSSSLESNISISREILTQDSIMHNRKKLCWNENDTRMLFKVATADLGSAWTAFKVVGKILSPGYGGAVAVLAGIGGSLYTWWLEGGISFSKASTNPHINITVGSSDPKFIGELHNAQVHVGIISSETRTKNIDDFSAATYQLYVKNVASATQTSEESLMENMPENTYKQILTEHDNMERPDEVYASAIQSGVSKHMAVYMKEFVTRIGKTSGLTYEDALVYADLFMDNVANQTSFTTTDKYNMVAIISVYKNSLTYWDYAIKNK